VIETPADPVVVGEAAEELATAAGAGAVLGIAAAGGGVVDTEEEIVVSTVTRAGTLAFDLIEASVSVVDLVTLAPGLSAEVVGDAGVLWTGATEAIVAGGTSLTVV